MLTPRHRALFDASYSALLLRSDSGERHQPPAPATPGQGSQDHNAMTEKDFEPGTPG
jgi:hypothetical protein